MILSNPSPSHHHPDSISSDECGKMFKLRLLLVIALGLASESCSLSLITMHQTSRADHPLRVSCSRQAVDFYCSQGAVRPSSGIITSAFLKRPKGMPSSSFPSTVLSSATDNTSTANENSNLSEQRATKTASSKDGRSALRFKASLSYTTEPVPLLNAQSASKKTLENFFTRTKHRNYLLIGTGNINVDSSGDATSALIARWNDECAYVGTVPPARKDQVVRLKISTNFLVFTIHVIATLGTKLIIRKTKPWIKKSENPALVHDDISSLEHQFTLLKEEFYAEGPPPLVWIFDQITAGIREDTSEEKQLLRPHTNHGSCRVWTEEIETKGDTKNKPSLMVFKSLTTVEINIMFPSLLLRILPVPTEIIEEQGSKSLQKSMERDVLPGLVRFRDAYLHWINN